MAYIVPKS